VIFFGGVGALPPAADHFRPVNKVRRLMKMALLNCSPKVVMLAFAAVAAAAVAGVAPAQAVEYPWCLYYGMSGGGHNCGFSTFAQCLASASGTGGHCSQNVAYSPSAGPRSGYYSRHRYRHHRYY
jgi:Protein of unknown function (DUF3551)